jgi:phage portal protein BeeE
LRRDEVLHVAGFGFDAMCGYSVVKVAKSVIRTGMAQDREAERFVTRGIRPPGAIKMPPGKKFADEKQAMKFRETFRKIHATEDGSLNIMILEDGRSGSRSASTRSRRSFWRAGSSPRRRFVPSTTCRRTWWGCWRR